MDLQQTNRGLPNIFFFAILSYPKIILSVIFLPQNKQLKGYKLHYKPPNHTLGSGRQNTVTFVIHTGTHETLTKKEKKKNLP